MTIDNTTTGTDLLQQNKKTEERCSEFPVMQSMLGAELMDIINVLRGFGAPEEHVVAAVWDHIRKRTTS